MTAAPTGAHDVAVVGGGPAGLAAAATALDLGLRVVLIDQGPALGGQYWRQPAPAAAGVAPRDLRDLHHGLDRFSGLLARLSRGEREGRLQLLLRTQVWTAVRQEGLVVLSTAGTGPAAVAGTVAARRLVLATGAHDVALPFPGWELPGVMTVGGLQALLKGSGVVAGRRVVLAGSGPFLLPVAVALARRGASVLGVHEASSGLGWARHLPAVGRNLDRLVEGAGYAAELARHRVAVHPRSMLVRAEGDGAVEAVTVQRLDARGRLVAGSDRRLEVDTVGVGWGFAPVIDLAVTLGCAVRTGRDGRLAVATDVHQRTSVVEVLVAGEATGVGGAALALTEGELAAHAAADGLPGVGGSRSSGTRGSGRHHRALTRRRASARDFADALQTVHTVPSGWAQVLTPSTLLCRCEDVPVGRVRDVLTDGADGSDGSDGSDGADGSLRSAGADGVRRVRQLTRVGMGWCQGRTCEAACVLLVEAAVGQRPTPAPRAPFERLVAQPVRLGLLADLEAATQTAGPPPEGDPARRDRGSV